MILFKHTYRISLKMLLQEEPTQQAVNRADWDRPHEFPEGGHRVECLTGVLEHLDLGICIGQLRCE